MKIAMTAVIASLYFAITIVLQPFSFLAIQVRISGALILLLPLFPDATLFGVSIGVLFANMVSPLGAIDLISAPVTFVAMLPLYFICKKGKKNDALIIAGGAIKCVVIAAWVSLLLISVFELPYWAFWLNFFLVLIGDVIAVIGIGFPLYKILHRYLPGALVEDQIERGDVEHEAV